MYRVLVLVVALLGSLAWAQFPQPAQDQSAQPAGDQAKEITATGCLQQSGAYLYLTHDDGTQIQVTGPKLDGYKGHVIEVSGERSSKAIDTTVSGAASSAQSSKLRTSGTWVRIAVRRPTETIDSLVVSAGSGDLPYGRVAFRQRRVGSCRCRGKSCRHS